MNEEKKRGVVARDECFLMPARPQKFGREQFEIGNIGEMGRHQPETLGRVQTGSRHVQIFFGAVRTP
jgi:hypothetical protein